MSPSKFAGHRRGGPWLGGMLFVICALIVHSIAFAADTVPQEAGHTQFPVTFLWIAVILVLARASSLIERVGQPAVLGELLIGVAAGSLYLAGVNVFEPIKSNEIVHFLAELGVVLLLLQIGIESSVSSMMKVGVPSFLVACAGVIMPQVVITYFVGPWLAPGLSSAAYIFLGATMTATSVGITARVLQDIGRSDTNEARIIIGAAVIDDVLGLIILAVVSSIVTVGSVETLTVVIIVVKALVFLGGGMLIGSWLAPLAGRFFAMIHTGAGMKFVMVVAFGLVFAYIASLVGLAPIVGAFTGGLILKPEYFEAFEDPEFVSELKNVVKEENMASRVGERLNGLIEKHSHKHIHVFTEHLGHFMVPIFFVLTGMQVKLAALADVKVLLMSAGILVAAMITKVAAGVVAGKGVRKLVVGIGMIPRGEVGLIFANMGKGMGVMDDTMFSAIVLVIMATTLLTPPVLGAVFKKK